MRKIRCAIYTRKSSEDGLEQSFNSLHAQREACAAYILSQASEGWSLLPDEYDDGGLSGGTLERPALQRLLRDINAGKIDIVVVYKVDRLTRSLLDFSTLVQDFDAAGTSFVSITQSFNTTTSMGRLTLNMLLSFAQFEREVTAERIRDKIAASKAKGMWMGGTPPLGYQPCGRTLTIIEEHAGIVRRIFSLYLELGNVPLLMERLKQDRVIQPVRQTATGRTHGGKPLSRGQLYAMLKNPIYVGLIPHREELHSGQHAAIVDRQVWDRAQEQLAENVAGERRGKRAEHSSLLAGIIVDETGEPMVAAHACKGNRRYRYYVSRAHHFRREDAKGQGMRIPAREIEAAVAQCLAQAFEKPLSLAANADLRLEPERLTVMDDLATATAVSLRAHNSQLIRSLVRSVKILPDRVSLELSTAGIAEALKLQCASKATMALQLEGKIRRSGKVVRLIQPDGRSAAATQPSQSLIKLIAKSRRWWKRLQEGDIHVAELARQEGVSGSYLANTLRLAFLSPRLVEMIVEGKQPAHLTGKMLTAYGFPASWAEQHARFA